MGGLGEGGASGLEYLGEKEAGGGVGITCDTAGKGLILLGSGGGVNGMLGVWGWGEMGVVLRVSQDGD